MNALNLEFELSPTQEEYVYSEKVVNILISNAGEGKSYASVVAMIVHAQRCGKPIRCAIVRDTHENIKLSTARTIQEVFEKHPQAIRFKNDYKQLTININPRVDVDLFGIDDLGALSKLQGPEYALIWLEEPAPMADKVNAGLSEEVYNAALLRCARQKGTKARLQVSMNPADEEHWTFRRFIEDPDFDPVNPLITKQVWFIPYGENSNLSEVARQAAKAAYKDDPASYARYVEGKFAEVYRGEKVTPQYKQDRHLSKYILIPAKGLVSFAFFDSWHTPACVLGQITQTGRLTFIDTLRLEGADIRTLIDNQVLPLLNSPKWKDKAFSWRIGGDFTMNQPDQSNRREKASKVVEEAFPGYFFEPGPSKWETIKRHIARAFQGSDNRGEPLVLLSADNKMLDKGFRGSWHYPKDNAGNVHHNAKPVKDLSSHPCDAAANAISVLLPTADVRKHLADYRKIAQKSKQRIESYATGGTRYA